MARPALTTTDRRRGGMRAAATLHRLSTSLGVHNPHQFARHFDAITGMDTQASGKWRQCFSAERGLSAQQLRLLSNVHADAVTLHEAGPSDLWHALWGDERTLWQLCRTRLDSNGPMVDDSAWSAVARQSAQAQPFEATIVEFEAEMLLAEAYGAPLTLRHLTEAVALHRLCGALNVLAIVNVDGAGVVRCLRLCLADTSVQLELSRLGVLRGVRQELANVIDSSEARATAGDRWDALAAKVAWIG